MRKSDHHRLVAFATFAVVPLAAHAYIGPGPGITIVGAAWAVFAALFVAFASILIWPIRVLLRRRKRRDAEQADAPAPARDATESADPAAAPTAPKGADS